MRPTVRLKMTLLYAGVVFVAGALLLSVSYVLVRQNLTNPSNLRNLPATNWDYNVAAQHEIAQDALARLRTQYAIALAAMTGLSVLLGWALAGRMLRPLQRITATAKRVSQDNLDERIGLEGPRDELKELADTFDGMLGRLSAAFASQRRFVANASHELRTPLTVIRTELEVTLADPTATTAELRAMGETVRDATLATERLIQALLTLARSEGGVQRRDPVDLAEAARATSRCARLSIRRRCAATGGCSSASLRTSSRTRCATTATAARSRCARARSPAAAASRCATTAT
jgi:signal transduction histidine kinase